MNEYLIPANANRGKLILGFFRKIDAIVFGCGILTTLLLLFVFQNSLSSGAVAFAVLSPALFTGFLILPVPNQHNVMVVIGNLYKFYFVNRNRFVWKGWCSLDGEENDK